ncbi:MAG: winged helix-turn-helix transcriptional regulator, partial [Nanoarchaeota archaeon]
MILKNQKSKSEKILELETRKRIYYIIKKYAGCHFREIQRKSKISHGTLKYNLNFLVKHDLILEQKENNSLYYFPKNFQTEKTKLLSHLRQKPTRNIILFITLNQNCIHSEIVRFVGSSPSTVS